MEYNVIIPQYTEFEKKLQKERDFFAYMRLLEGAKKDYLIVVVACDTPVGPLFDNDHFYRMRKSLGLKLDMQNAFRQPYIAIIDYGELIYEQTSKNLAQAVKFEANFANHKYFIYSGGYECTDEFGVGALVKVDDAPPYWGGRGLNFYIFNPKKNYMVDFYHSESFKITSPQSFLGEQYQRGKLYSAIENNSRGGGTIYCLFNNPAFPKENLSLQEKIMLESDFDFDNLYDETMLKKVWNKKLLHFCNDFDSMEDLREAITAPLSYEDVTGVVKFYDHASKTVNTKNGVRITTNQPKRYKRSVFLVGTCTTFGVGADDFHTIASFLQRKLNERMSEEGFIVYNYGYYLAGDNDRLFPVLSHLPLKEDDIVFFRDCVGLHTNLPYCDLTLKAKRPHNYGDIFLDMGHYTANGNRMIADGIFEFLERHDFFRNATMNITRLGAERTKNENANDTKENELLTNYKNELTEFFKEKILPTVGAIVMNANPFTYGHRYLVEEALKQCDRLIVFVVEEDKSEIPFEDRFDLVKKNLADLPKVFVRRSGEFIISSKTFSEYFCKESLQEQKIDTTLDVTLFAREIAPCLNVSIRFAGKEPMDNVTKQYNEDMAKILPQYGINFVEIERKQTAGGEIISASTVRRLVKAREFEKLKDFVPPATFEYLLKRSKTSIYSR